jgi:serine protease Do
VILAASILALATLGAPGAVSGDGATIATERVDWKGHDPFDSVETVEDLRRLETQVIALAAALRPTVVNLRLGGRGAASTGTGVVISSDGLVATCGHVGQRAGRRVTATLADGTVLQGKTLGQANEGALDCGLVQLETEGRTLDCAPLGTSRDAQAGDWLVVLGFTQGPPSEPRPALVRVGRVVRNTPEELLFDAPIDAGDSGGPSFNLRGEVVAVNSRCGRQPWENAATPIDRLRERMWEFRDGIDERLMRSPFGDDDVGGDDVRTNFARAASEGTRMEVQRALPFDDVVATARASMVRVMDGKASVAYGTVVDRDGHAVTKRSQLPEGWQDGSVALETVSGEPLTASVVGVDRTLDLAVLRIPSCPVPPIEWRRSGPIAPGQVLLTPRMNRNGPALGFAAIERRESERDWSMTPYLGVRTEPATGEQLRAAGTASGARVEEVVQGTAADDAGLQVGDLILAVDGTSIDGRFGLRRSLGDRAAGDRVTLSVFRDGTAIDVVAELRRRPTAEGGSATRGNTMTPISAVSTGFGEVFAHDGIVWPEQCGGPVVDLDGNAVGLNVARYDRTATHAIDPKTLMKAVDRVIRDAARTREAGSAPN